MAKKTEMEVNISANISDLTKAINEAKKLIQSLADSISKGLKLSVDSKSLKKDINSAIQEVNSANNTKNLIVSVDGTKLKAGIKSALREAIRQVNTEGVSSKLKIPSDKSIKVKVDTSSARTSLSNLQNMFKQREIRINTGKAEGDIIRLSTYMNQLAKKNVVLGVDVTRIAQAKLDITELSTYLNQLKSKNIKVRIDFENKDIVNHLKSIDDLLKSIQKNSNINLKMTGSGGGGGVKTNLQSQVQQYRTLRQEARQFALEAEKAWTAGDKAGFEKNRQNFQVAMKDLADFSRQLGNLSASREAGMYSNMLRSLQQTSPLYQDILNKIKQLKQEQKDFNNLISDGNKKLKQESTRSNQRYDKVPGFMQGTLGASAYVIRFLGRSSKGFGSFGEAVSQFITDIGSLGGSFRMLATPIAALAGSIAVTATAFTVAIKGVQFFGNLLSQIGQELYNVLKPGIDLYKQQTSAFFSFTASFMSNGLINGQKLSEMPVGKDTAVGLSDKLLAKAQLDAEMSAFSLQDILASLQGTLPILMSHGMTAQQAYEINKGVAAVAKMIQLTPSQILQETRDLAQGSVTSRGSQVANALGVTNADLKKFEGDAEGLYRFLMEKFKQYGELLQEFEDTALGRFQQLQERWQTVARNMIEGVLPQFKGLFEGLIEMTGQWVSTSGTYVNQFGERVKYTGRAILDALTGDWNDEFGNVLKDFKYDDKPFFEMSEPFEKIKEALPEIIKYLASAIDEIIQFVEEETGISDPIELAKEGIKLLIDGFVISVKVVVSLISSLETVRDLLIDFEPILVPIINIIRSIGNGFKFVSACIQVCVNDIEVAIAGIRRLWSAVWDEDSNYAIKKWDEAIARRKKSGDVAEKAFYDWYNMESYSTYDDMLSSLRKRKNVKITTVEDFVSKYASGELSVKGTTKNLSDLKGSPKNTEDEKARKKAIQEAQKIMKEHIQGLKEELKEHIGQLKDVLEQNEIAFSEGFISMKEYYEQKAQIEAEESRARLQEAKEEKEWILKTPYEHEADRLKALHTVDREIRQYTRELGKATRAQQEVSRSMEKFIEAQQAVAGFMVGDGSLSSATGVVVNSSSYDSLLSFNPQSLEDKIAWAVQMAMVQGFDKESASAIVGNWLYESGGALNPNALGDNGTSYGIAQWHNERWDELIRWAKENNSDSSDYRTQVLFGLHELIRGREKGNFYANNGSRLEQTRNYMNNVERPSAEARVESFQSRLDGANMAYNLASRQLVQASSSLNDASSNLVSASSDMIGYLPESQNSRAGMDIRYSVFEDMSSGVETQISGLNEGVKAVFNLFSKKYFEKTGEKVLWTSFTGDMRNGGVNNPHSTSEKGHRYGWKGDLWVSNNTVATQIAQELGLALGDEFDHLDLSAWGGVGGTVLTTNSTAEDLHEKIIQANNAISNLSNTGLTNLTNSAEDWNEAFNIINDKAPALGILMLKQANTTKIGHDAYKAGQDYLTTFVEMQSNNLSRVTGNLKAQIMKDVPKLVENVKKYKTDSQMLEQIFIDFNNTVRDKMVSFAKNMADFNLKVIERNAEYRGIDMMASKFSFKELYDRYSSYFSDLTNKSGLAKYVEMLEQLYLEYESRGFTQEAFEIREYLDGLKQKLVNLQKNWIDKIGEFYDRQQSLFDATEGFTDLQREFGTRELKAYKAQANYEAYSIMLDDVNKKISDNNFKLVEAQKIVKSLAEGTKERANYESTINTLIGEGSRLEGLKQEYEYQKKINDLQRQQPEFLRDLRNTAKQALEDGLVTFLTDGVNEAESLGEALRNLAVTFLKEIQQLSAKWMIKSLMTKWFGGYEMDAQPSIDGSAGAVNAITSGASNIVNAVNLGTNSIVQALTGKVFSIGGLTENTFGTVGLADGYTGYYDRFMVQQNSNTLGAFSSSWQNSPLNHNRQYSFNTQDYGLNSLNNVAQQSATNIGLLGSNSIEAGNAIANSFANLISQEGMSQDLASMVQLSEYITGMVIPSFDILKVSLENMNIAVGQLTASLSAIGGIGGMATGGFIQGPGTSTSDSIPAMLSDGEYVIKADSVRKYGTNFLNAVNEGKFGKIKSKVLGFAQGGEIGTMSSQETARGTKTFANQLSTSMNMTNHYNIALVRDENEAMEQFMRSPRGQNVMLDFNRKTASYTNRIMR